MLQNEVTRSLESETSSITQFTLWVWSGSRYSGLLCMTLSSTIYFLMEVLSSNFSGMFHTDLRISLHDAFSTCIMIEITRRKCSGIWLQIARGFDCNGSLWLLCWFDFYQYGFRGKKEWTQTYFFIPSSLSLCSPMEGINQSPSSRCAQYLKPTLFWATLFSIWH